MGCECVCSPNQAMVGRVALGPENSHPIAKIPAVGKRTTTAPLLHKSTGSTFDASTLSSSSFSFSHGVRPPIASLNSCSGCSSAGFTLYTAADYQNLPDLRAPARQIYALPRRLAPPIEQLGKFQIERDDNFLEQRCWILQQWARECK